MITRYKRIDTHFRPKDEDLYQFAISQVNGYGDASQVMRQALEIARLFNGSLAQAQLAARAFQFDIIREHPNTPGMYQIENPHLGRHWVDGEMLRGMGYELPENVTNAITDGNQGKIINYCEELAR